MLKRKYLLRNLGIMIHSRNADHYDFPVVHGFYLSCRRESIMLPYEAAAFDCVKTKRCVVENKNALRCTGTGGRF
jgi:hypothetical protein